MDAELKITAETDTTGHRYRALVLLAKDPVWIRMREMVVLCTYAAERLEGDGWIGVEDMIQRGLGSSPYDIYQHNYKLRQIFGPAIIEGARRRGQFRLGIEKGRIEVDPALSEHCDHRVRAMFRGIF